MSFGIADLIGVVVIEARLRHLRENPDELNFILSPFCKYAEIRDKVGARYIDEAARFVLDNSIHIAPYYQADLQKLPSVVVLNRTGEAQQYIGEVGYTDHAIGAYAPIIYYEFDVSGIEGNVLLVPNQLKIEEHLWRNILVSSGDFVSKVNGIHVGTGTNNTRILLESDIPSGTPMRGWKAQSSDKIRNYQVSSSTDDAEIVARLTTTGDYGIHRLLNVVVRYCLKSGRSHFENLGFQVPIVSQGLPVAEGDAQMQYTTVFSVRGKLTEHWVSYKFNSNDPSDSIDAALIASKEGSDVVLE